jgi:hypothetical protein
MDQKEFAYDLNNRLDAAEALFSKLAHQEIAKKAARTPQHVANTQRSDSPLESSEARQFERSAL